MKTKIVSLFTWPNMNKFQCVTTQPMDRVPVVDTKAENPDEEFLGDFDNK